MQCYFVPAFLRGLHICHIFAIIGEFWVLHELLIGKFGVFLILDGKSAMAGQYLADLPSRGFFGSSVFSSSYSDGMRVYVCDHNTTPPEEQLIKTDSTNILIRSLTLKKTKADTKPRDAKRKAVALNGKGKRPAERPLDDKLAAKRVNSNNFTGISKKEASSSRLSDKELQNCTVDKLRSLLKERGLPTKGKKDELVARLKR